MHILLVEDQELHAMILQQIALYKAPNSTITWVSNGEKAVKEIKDGKKYDAIIMSFKMPLMNGVTATRQIRALGYTNYILGWSAFTKREKEAICLEAGMNYYLEKDAQMDDIIAFLQGTRF